MRKSILLFLTVLLTHFVFSQSKEDKTNDIPSTSVEEYNYMTKGLKIQLTSGLDTKKGYTLENLKTIQRGSYSFSFKALIRTEEKQLAGIIVIASSQVSGRNYYLGMPINNDQLQSAFENDIKNWDESMTTAFAQAVSELFSKTIMNNYQLINDTTSKM